MLFYRFMQFLDVAETFSTSLHPAVAERSVASIPRLNAAESSRVLWRQLCTNKVSLRIVITKCIYQART